MTVLDLSSLQFISKLYLVSSLYFKIALELDELLTCLLSSPIFLSYNLTYNYLKLYFYLNL